MGRPWIKLSTATFDDEKIRIIETLPDGKTILVIWLKLLCLAGKTDNDGVFRLTKNIPYNEDLLANVLRENVATVRLALKTFIDMEMMEKIEGAYALSNWTKYQSETGAIEAAKAKKHERQKRWREKQKSLLLQGTSGKRDVSETSTGPSVDAEETPLELGEEKEKEKEKEKDKDYYYNGKPSSSPFHFFDSNFHPVATSYEKELIEDMVNDYGEQWTLDAMKEAVKQGVRKLKYVDGILKSWKARGGPSSRRKPEKGKALTDAEKEDLLREGFEL